MKDEEIDRALMNQRQDVAPALAAKIRARIQSDTHAVKPMWSGTAYVWLFAGIVAAAGSVFASILGFKGLHVLSIVEALEFLSALLVLSVACGAMVARGMRPASGNLHNWLLGGLALLAYEALVVIFFNSYSTDGFARRGVLCLSLGVLCGVFAALPLWFVARRGLVVEPVRTGALIGLAGGLSGLLMLTLHCPLLTAPHAGVWHAAVIVVCVAAGAALGRSFLIR